MTKKVPPGGQKMNFSKNRLREVDQRAMPIGKMVLLLILPFGNPKSARGGHPYLRILFPFIKGTTLVRNTYLPITEMNDSQGLLQRIEEEKNDNDKADIRSLRGNLETLRMDHDAFWTSAEREKKDIHQKIETLEVIHTTEFRILLNCPFLN